MSTELNYIPNDYIYDIETYPNVFTLATSSSDGKVVRVWEVSDRMNQTQEILNYLRHLAKKKWRQVGFNNLGFDYPVLHAIMEQAREAKRQGFEYYINARDVYNIAMAQIQTARDGFAKVIKSEEEIIPQIDLFKINHFDNKAKATSLKTLEFNMRSENIEDLPFPVGKELTFDEIDVLKFYNLHDVAETKKFYHYNVGAIKLREDLTNKYGFNCMNLSDTDIGTRFFMQKIEKVKPDAFYKKTPYGKQKKQTKRNKIVIKDCLFNYLKFDTEEFKSLHDWFSKQVITETKGVFSDVEESSLGELSKYCEMVTKRVKFKSKPSDKELSEFMKQHPKGWVEEQELKAMETVKDENGNLIKEEYLDDNGVLKTRNKKVPKISYYGYYNVAETLNVLFKDFRVDLGVGGLHGAKRGTIKETETHSIMSYDVASMYPNIAIANRVYPEHLGESFCDSYEDFYNERKKFPKGTPENLAIKLGLNSVYGKSNDKYSPFLDPMYTMKITINGQLSLCMLMEQIVLRCDARLIMANTDGFEFYIEKSKEDLAKSIVAEWEKIVGLQMELAMYKAMYIRDVNNYYSVYDNGSVKMKGAYEYLDLAWHKNFSALVIPMAVKKQVIDGIDYREFLHNHKDEYDFMLRVKVPRNCSLVLVDEESETENKLQNVCRYYPSVDGGKLVKIMPPLEGSFDFRRLSVESNWKVKPCNNMKEFDWNIDYDYYIQEIEKLIEPFNQQITWEK